MIPLAVAFNEYKTPGRTFFEKYIKTNKIHVFNMNFKHSFIDQQTIASFITIFDLKNFIFFLYMTRKSQHLLNPTPYKQDTLH